MLGFDIDAATLTLYREAVAAGAIPNKADGPDGMSDVAEAHLHGLQPSRRSRSPGRAGARPRVLRRVRAALRPPPPAPPAPGGPCRGGGPGRAFCGLVQSRGGAAKG